MFPFERYWEQLLDGIYYVICIRITSRLKMHNVRPYKHMPEVRRKSFGF